VNHGESFPSINDINTRDCTIPLVPLSKEDVRSIEDVGRDDVLKEVDETIFSWKSFSA
jgi:hypothetical protein